MNLKGMLFGVILGVVLLTGCSKEVKKEEDKIIGTWETKYELGVFGEVSESYTFKEAGKCIRTINTGSEIINNCTYEFNDTKTQIRIIWDDKIDKESYSKYVEEDDNNIIISEHKYTRK